MKVDRRLFASLLLVIIGLPLDRARAANPGETAFRQHCATCHSFTPGGSFVAPDLKGIVGRKAGSAAGYQYSEALKNAGFVWTPARLNEWLANPHSAVPGTEMPFPGLKSEKERAEIVEYLKQRAK